ncbi:PEPxxWA-CTERM sorting domain-containing protein [Pseudokordiimonas caeni]|uniref:PEPxxWA-CTERM sorting domain-containing protein n=1 Tax=Pseudokordiimonas caeni TaxID=2997908 RepID=UPI002811602A|nr:PEPxxWA-CTERM sorting domain-containing protein [Pseudokordiimonas caeni]
MNQTVVKAVTSAILAVSFCFMVPAGAAHAVTYSLALIDDFPGGYDHSYAYGINDAGQVVGYSSSASGQRAFLWEDGVMTDLGVLLGEAGYSRANGINNSGQIVGVSGSASGQRAFLWEDGVMTDLGDLPGGWDRSEAFAINDAGQIVGSSYTGADTGNGKLHAFLWEDGIMTDLGALASRAESSQAYAINNAGLIVGESDAGLAGDHAVIWENGVLTDIGSLPDIGTGVNALATGINNLGQVIGASTIASTEYEYRAFFWDDGEIIDLGDFPGGDNYSWAYGINDAGQVVGSSPSATEGGSAFIWERETGMVDLNDLIVSDLDYTAGIAMAINEVGQITGWGTYRDGSGESFRRSFVLTPILGPIGGIPEPATWLMMIMGFGITGLAVRRRRALAA